MKGIIVINLLGHESSEQLQTWRQAIENIFKPGRTEQAKGAKRLAEYFFCNFESIDQVRALVLATGGVIVRKADDVIDSGVMLGGYGECVLEIPDIDDPERLNGPPTTFQVDYSLLPDSVEHVGAPNDDHTRIVLLPNYNGPEPDVTLATFSFEPPSEAEDVPVPTTLEEAVDTLIRGMPLDYRKRFMEIPRERILGQTHMTLGMSIRNGWQLWDKHSPLMRQFPGKQPDDVSDIIIEAVWTRLQQQR